MKKLGFANCERKTHTQQPKSDPTTIKLIADP
jgi:hypothetical protein